MTQPLLRKSGNECVWPNSQFGYWKVLKVGSDRNRHGKLLAECQCTCGQTKLVTVASLIQGTSKSCGCKRPKIWNKGIKKTPIGQSAKNEVYIRYKSNAKSRHLLFNLSKECFFGQIELPCFYCNSPPCNVQKVYSRGRIIDKYVYTGIDRLDNRRGYIPGNVVPCCKYCNAAKGQRTGKEFAEYCRNIAKRLPAWACKSFVECQKLAEVFED